MEEDKKDKKKIQNYEELETWDEAGPESLEEHPIPEDIDVKFAPDDEINSKITLWVGGDSTKLQIDAVVNAANELLRRGGGICGALHRAAGPELAKACKKLSPCDTGDAVVTKGFKLPAKFVIHAVGPVGEKPIKLRNAYNSILNYIDGKKIRSVALCSLSTGIFGYPVEPATRIAMRTVRRFLEDENNRENTDRIIFVVFDPDDIDVFYQIIHEYFPLVGKNGCGKNFKPHDEEEDWVDSDNEEEEDHHSDSDKKPAKKVSDDESDSDKKPVKKPDKKVSDDESDSDKKPVKKPDKKVSDDESDSDKKTEKKTAKKDDKPKKKIIPKEEKDEPVQTVSIHIKKGGGVRIKPVKK